MIVLILVIALALIIDKLLGDPPTWPHPVRWIGNLILILEKRLNKGKGKQLNGIIMVSIVILISFSLSLAVVFSAYKIHLFFGILVEASLIATTICQRSLKEAALAVYQPLKEGDLNLARHNLSFIVGRQTANLSEEEITKATIETVSENICDGITAPLFWASLGGAPLAILYRAINTCDSMVGYKNDRYREFGFASAKLDDLANFLPSRITGIISIFSLPQTWGQLTHNFKILFRDARKHNSPNSGWGEAATAALLGISLGGPSSYNGLIVNHALMGTAYRETAPEDIKQAVKIMDRTIYLFFILFLIGGIIIEFTCPWS